ncbi:MAG: hypothetical protein Q9167_007191, partial [Letrouitia subvulpina]
MFKDLRIRGHSKVSMMNREEREEREKKRKIDNQKRKEQRWANKAVEEEERKKWSLSTEAMTARRIKREAEAWRQEEEGLLELIPGMVTRGK